MEENIIVPENTPTPTPVLPEQPKTSHKGGLIALLVLVLIGVGGWFAFKAYASPAKVWEKFISSSENVPSLAKTAVSETTSMSYKDNGKIPDNLKSNPGMAFYSGLKFSVNGTGYSDSSNTDRPEASADISYSFGSGNTSFSSSAKVIVLNKDIYVNLGDNPFVNGIMAALAPGEKIEWIKINGEEISKASGATSTPDYSKQMQDYMNVVQKHLPKVISLDHYIDRQTIRGVKTVHYANKVDNAEVKAMFSELADLVFSQVEQQGAVSPEDSAKSKEIVKKVFNNLAERWQVSSVETWIGASDHMLHKIKIVSNAPSLVSLMAAGQDSALMEIQDPNTAVDAVLKALTFDAEFTLEEEFYDFGKKQEVKAPDNAYDIAKKIEDSQEKTPVQMQIQ